MIRHILKDGTEVQTVEGVKVSVTEHELLYEVIAEIERKGGETNGDVETSKGL